MIHLTKSRAPAQAGASINLAKRLWTEVPAFAGIRKEYD